MKLKKLIYLLLLASFMSNSSTLVMLKDGQNNIDLNNNGITDIIFLASFDNNTSHPNRTATIFMKDNKNGQSFPLQMIMGLFGAILAYLHLWLKSLILNYISIKTIIIWLKEQNL